MKHFIVYETDSAVVLRSGQCLDTDLEAQAGGDPALSVVETTAEVVAQLRAARSGFVVTENGIAPKPLTPEELIADELRAFAIARRQGYGSIEDQLDLIYHQGMDAWRNHICQVKAQITKPNMT